MQPPRGSRNAPTVVSASYVSAGFARCFPRRSSGWPGSERHADLPLMTERVDNPAESPAMLVAHRGRLLSAGGDCLPDHAVGLVDHEQRPACRTIDRARAEALHGR